ncbi:MAG TPA: type II secretion system major pseudopilin GspG [Planctomycetota bacterium]|nr:type II secretion system major pseudopilin GspG [Planctomycetota bacterium]
MRKHAGFTLVEMIVVIAIIGILATLVVVRYSGQTDQAKVAAAKSQLAQIEGAVISFHSHVGRLPKDLSELVEQPIGVTNWQEGGYLKGKSVPKDPWGNDYVYKMNGRRFEILSLGADGKEGGTGVDSDLSNEGAADPKK